MGGSNGIRDGIAGSTATSPAPAEGRESSVSSTITTTATASSSSTSHTGIKLLKRERTEESRDQPSGCCCELQDWTNANGSCSCASDSDCSQCPSPPPLLETFLVTAKANGHRAIPGKSPASDRPSRNIANQDGAGTGARTLPSPGKYHNPTVQQISPGRAWEESPQDQAHLPRTCHQPVAVLAPPSYLRLVATVPRDDQIHVVVPSKGLQFVHDILGIQLPRPDLAHAITATSATSPPSATAVQSTAKTMATSPATPSPGNYRHDADNCRGKVRSPVENGTDSHNGMVAKRPCHDVGSAKQKSVAVPVGSMPGSIPCTTVTITTSGNSSPSSPTLNPTRVNGIAKEATRPPAAAAVERDRPRDTSHGWRWTKGDIATLIDLYDEQRQRWTGCGRHRPTSTVWKDLARKFECWHGQKPGRGPSPKQHQLKWTKMVLSARRHSGENSPGQPAKPGPRPALDLAQQKRVLALSANHTPPPPPPTVKLPALMSPTGNRGPRGCYAQQQKPRDRSPVSRATIVVSSSSSSGSIPTVESHDLSSPSHSPAHPCSSSETPSPELKKGQSDPATNPATSTAQTEGQLQHISEGAESTSDAASQCLESSHSSASTVPPGPESPKAVGVQSAPGAHCELHGTGCGQHAEIKHLLEDVKSLLQAMASSLSTIAANAQTL